MICVITYLKRSTASTSSYVDIVKLWNRHTQVIYFKGVHDNYHIHLSLVMAKTKVAPIKQHKIPHLELCEVVAYTNLQ